MASEKKEKEAPSSLKRFSIKEKEYEEARHDRELYVAGRRDDVFFLDMVQYCEVERSELTIDKSGKGISVEQQRMQ